MQVKINTIEKNYEIVKKAHNTQNRKVNALKQEVSANHDKIQLLLRANAKREKEVKLLNETIVDMKAQFIRANLVVTGIIEQADENYKRKTESFFHNKMGLPAIQIAKTYRRGAGLSRPMVVVLQDASQKKEIFNNLKVLKNLRNERDKFY